MRVLAIVLMVLASGTAMAQTTKPHNPVGTPKASPGQSPYGTEWAQPSGQTGGYIYDDPRMRAQPGVSSTQRCPQGMSYSPTLRRCV
jgi:hypothetical protein